MPVPQDVLPVQRNLVRDEVYSTLKQWILEGSLRPGEKLRDKSLADVLNVSRMPVREALRRLEDEGLVETALNRWTRVSVPDAAVARRIYPIMWELEPLAVSLASQHLTSEDLATMMAANERLAGAVQGGDGPGASRADYEFHDVFISRSGNPELHSILNDLKVKLRRLEVAYFDGRLIAERSVTEHWEILSALKRQNYQEAAAALRRNWQQSLERVLASLEEQGHDTG